MTRCLQSVVVAVVAGIAGSSALGLGGCTSPSSAPAPILYGDAAAGNAETPPTSGADVEAWLRQGAYLKWTCEPAVHASRGPSPHGFDRVCSNDLVSPTAYDPDAGAWPQGAAEVKELYTSLTATTPAGYAVTLKTKPASAGGAGWYWYERQTDQNIEADGLGDNGSALGICVPCHSAAGSGAADTTSLGSRDFIYTPVGVSVPVVADAGTGAASDASDSGDAGDAD